MKEYHKIQTVFLRSPESKFKDLLDGQFALPEFAYLKDCEWTWTEKIDGMNIRVLFDGATVRFGGRSDDALIPPHLREALETTFTVEKMSAIFTMPCCLYGEGYGFKIQSVGTKYLPKSADFILFDCRIGEFWLERTSLEDISQKLHIKIVPIIGKGTLLEAVEFTRRGFNSTISAEKMTAEGLIMKPKIELFTRKGERIIAKIKHKDFKNG